MAVAAQLSGPRLGPYLAACSGNTKAALKLYRWNIDLSGAAYEALHVFEIMFRNAIDQQLCAWNAQQVERGTGRSHGTDWLMDPSHLLQRLARKDIDKASGRARSALRSSGRTPGHPDILAQLSFGTWRYLLPSNDPGRQRLWRDALHLAFPLLAGPPATLVAHVDAAYKLRNRVAHLEPLLRPGMVRSELTAMREVLKTIDPVCEQWFTSRQRVTSTLRARPV
jgi:hypothetical protein